MILVTLSMTALDAQPSITAGARISGTPISWLCRSLTCKNTATIVHAFQLERLLRVRNTAKNPFALQHTSLYFFFGWVRGFAENPIFFNRVNAIATFGMFIAYPGPSPLPEKGEPECEGVAQSHGQRA